MIHGPFGLMVANIYLLWMLLYGRHSKREMRQNERELEQEAGEYRIGSKLYKQKAK